MKCFLKKSLLSLSLSLAIAIASPKAVVMDFGAVDTLQALDAADLIVALPKGNLPHYLQSSDWDSVEDSGGMKSPDLTKFKEMPIDLIVISPRLGNQVETLSEYAPVLNFTVDSDNYFESVSENITKLAKFADREEAADAALAKLAEQISQIQREIAKSDQQALVVIHNDGKLMATPTSGSAKFIHNVLGVKNAEKAPKEGRQVADLTYLTEVAPDLIFIIDRSAAIGATSMDQQKVEETLIQPLNEALNKQVKMVYLDPTLWYLSGNGLISIVKEAQEIEAALKEK